MVKLAKILLPLSWMGFIFILSGIPVEYFPETASNYYQIAAHIFLYFILAFLMIIAILSWSQKYKLYKVAFAAVFISILYGISDEYHQGFVFGRFVSFADLFFDFFGAGLGAIFYLIIHPVRKTKILLHICCAGCGAYVSKLLKKNYSVILYFYNSNIYPNSEYNKRLKEVKTIAKKFNLKLLTEEYNHDKWLNKINGHEHDKERGERCLICYKDRIESTAKTAKEGKFDYFSTTLTVSPHKDAGNISKIGKKMAMKYKIAFFDKDFKKKDGFKKSVELSKELNLYRQNYCGCEFSYLPLPARLKPPMIF